MKFWLCMNASVECYVDCLPDSVTVLREAGRVLKAGSLIVITFSNHALIIHARPPPTATLAPPSSMHQIFLVPTHVRSRLPRHPKARPGGTGRRSDKRPRDPMRGPVVGER